ncbi:TetR/AcrR family transcriptional regulator [Variovorax sp. J22R24]|uniref:TetR/AcrR family transcriptional regulator n=1 Tax=Variovorax gracilis TaxID=3053502 RepID=UPI002577EE34|nr:TetR/AcrR family transcriptional regulator [Variovorax sp. J22R24]MDM0106933.1 TetR/AcrR family transcriptional regulator [Variovorax sp. J22R24]
MPPKTWQRQEPARRLPSQARSLEKVELMLEAATRLLDQGGLPALNTNRVAEVAGVSIGTLYQYFRDKAALLDALAQRELQAMADGVLQALTEAPPEDPGDRMRAIVRTVLSAYGGRTRVHRVLLEHALTGTTDSPLRALRTTIVELMTSTGIVAFDGKARSLKPAEAFVLTNSVFGVLRAVLALPDPFKGPQKKEVEDALVRLVANYLALPPRR